MAEWVKRKAFHAVEVMSYAQHVDSTAGYGCMDACSRHSYDGVQIGEVDEWLKALAC